ncbi:MAG: acetoin utilization protein AcuC [Frankiaceae bacterium]|nr:acetoin utilization protein AcuC [Frankiaceae bacterium]MDQ1674067.1 acetoin utilization protein AcuC [Frankiaceae bacterium]
MSGSATVVWDDDFLSYDPGEGHPMRPVRLDLTMRLTRALGLLDRPGVSVTGAEPVSSELLSRVHDADYVRAVRRAMPDERYGLGTMDDPVWPQMHDASALVTGASVAAADAVRSGRAVHAVSIAGGLHHAQRTRASGFCVYNDPAVAIRALLDDGVRSVAYIDVDAHHGDGVQNAFYDDPRVMTISLHQSGRTLFPGTGFPTELGVGEAEGTSVNVALPGFTGDAGWLRAFSGVVPVLLRAFEPEILVTQCGCDAHRADPLTDLRLSVDGQRAAYLLLHDLAHELCDGRWIALGGGGYAMADVVPRAWTHLIATVTGAPVPPDTAVPMAWRTEVRTRLGILGPAAMTDTSGTVAGTAADDPSAASPAPEGRTGQPATDPERGIPAYVPWDAGDGDPDDPVDIAVAATRREVLPLHGLDPWLDR